MAKLVIILKAAVPGNNRPLAVRFVCLTFPNVCGAGTGRFSVGVSVGKTVLNHPDLILGRHHPIGRWR